MKAYAQDLREHVLRAVDLGRPRAEIVQLFGISSATLKQYIKQQREEGHVRPRAIPGRAPKKRAQLEAGLTPQLQEHNDATLEQHCAMWEQAHGERVSRWTMSRAIKWLGWTQKKVSGGERAQRGRACCMARESQYNTRISMKNPCPRLLRHERSMDTEIHGTGVCSPILPFCRDEAFGDTVCLKKKSMIGEHGQGFLGLGRPFLADETPVPTYHFRRCSCNTFSVGVRALNMQRTGFLHIERGEKDVLGWHGQGFLVWRTGVRGEENLCPYSAPPNRLESVGYSLLVLRAWLLYGPEQTRGSDVSRETSSRLQKS